MPLECPCRRIEMTSYLDEIFEIIPCATYRTKRRARIEKFHILGEQIISIRIRAKFIIYDHTSYLSVALIASTRFAVNLARAFT